MKQRHSSAAAALVCLLLTPATAWVAAAPAAASTQRDQAGTDAALAAIDRVLAQDPRHAEANLKRGVILAETGRTAEAVEVFRRLIDEHPQLPEAYNNLAVIQAAQGDFDDAVKTLKGALATNASYQTAYENLTRIFAQLASEAYSRALEVESPPAREEVELVMLADLAAAPVASSPPILARRKVTPEEPMRAVAVEPLSDEGGADESSGLQTATAEPAPAESEPAAAPAPAEDAAPSPPPAPVASEDLEVGGIDASEEQDAKPPVSTRDLAGLVDDWARAWSEQRVDDYLSFYAAEFEPADGTTREDWEARRRERISGPEFIRVEVAILDMVAEATDRASVTFLQRYESDTFSDQVTKTLTLVRRESGWKILLETVES